MNSKEISKTIGRATFIGIKNLVLISVIAFFVNLIFAISAAGNFAKLAAAIGGVGGTIVSILCILIFVVGFPLVYIILAKIYSVKKAIFYVIRKAKAPLIVFLISRLVKKSGTNPDNKKEIKNFVLKNIRNLQGLSFFKRMIFDFFISKVDIIGVTTAIIDNSGDEITTETIAIAANDHVDDFINETVFLPSYTIFSVLVLLNISAFIAFKIYF